MARALDFSEILACLRVCSLSAPVRKREREREREKEREEREREREERERGTRLLNYSIQILTFIDRKIVVKEPK